MSGSAQGRVRIVAGAQRGRLLQVPRGREVRPTAGIVREAVFDALGAVAGLRVLDLFAGTGALGMEALSRGARDCVFVEDDPRVAAILCKNVAALQYELFSTVMVADYHKALPSLQGRAEGFDLLFVDPPYRMLAEVEVTLEPLLPRLVKPSGVVIVEGPKSINVTFGCCPVFERDYRDTKVTMIEVRRSEA